MKALLALHVADREERIAGDAVHPARTEVILARVGLGLGSIASITGKNYETVKTIVRRGREAEARSRSRAGSENA
jgi:DNA-directed RNA polymerase specialized sigma24 family protein